MITEKLLTLDFSKTDDDEKNHLVGELQAEAGFKKTGDSKGIVTMEPTELADEGEARKLCSVHNIPLKFESRTHRMSIESKVSALLGSPVTEGKADWKDD